MQVQGEGKLSVLHPLRRRFPFHARRKAFNSSHPQQLFLTVPAARTARQVSVSGKYGTLRRCKIFVWIGGVNCGCFAKDAGIFEARKDKDRYKGFAAGNKD